MLDKSNMQKNNRLARKATGRKPIVIKIYLIFYYKNKFYTFSCNINFFLSDLRLSNSLIDFHSEFFGIS